MGRGAKEYWYGSWGLVILERKVRKSSFEKPCCEQRSEVNEEMSHADIWEKRGKQVQET